MPLQEAVPRQWFWRRVLSYALCTALSGIALVAVLRSPDPQWIGVAAIAALWLVSLQYVTSATAEDIVRITKATAEGMARAKD